MVRGHRRALEAWLLQWRALKADTHHGDRLRGSKGINRDSEGPAQRKKDLEVGGSEPRGGPALPYIATQCPIVASFQAPVTVTGARGRSWGPRGSDSGGVFTVKSICQVYVQCWRKSKREGGGDGFRGGDKQEKERCGERETERGTDPEEELESGREGVPVSSAFLSKALHPSDFTPPSLPWDSPQRSL